MPCKSKNWRKGRLSREIDIELGWFWFEMKIADDSSVRPLSVCAVQLTVTFEGQVVKKCWD